MVYCCVPFCKSDASKGKGVSFHEFPVDSDLRSKWLENVSRKDWSPQDRSVVCGRHFLATDYKPGKLIRRLKVNAVPTVFEDYPIEFQEIIKKRSRINPCLVVKPPTDHDYTKCPKIRIENVRVTPPNNVNFSVVDATLNECDTSQVFFQIQTNSENSKKSQPSEQISCPNLVSSADISPRFPADGTTIYPTAVSSSVNQKSPVIGTGECPAVDIKQPSQPGTTIVYPTVISSVSTHQKYPVSGKSVCPTVFTGANINQIFSAVGKTFCPTVVTSADINQKSVGSGRMFRPVMFTRADIGPPSPPRVKAGRKCISPITMRKNIHTYQTKLRRHAKRIELMKKKIKELNQTVKSLSFLKAKITKTEYILKDAESGVRSAGFISEQIKLYGTKKYKWSEDMIRECIIWRAESVKGYEYARRSGLLKLPSRTTLKRYIGFSIGGTGVSSLIKQRLHKVCARLKPTEKQGVIVWKEIAMPSMSSDTQCSDANIGQVIVDGESVEDPADRLLCFVFKGLNSSLRIPVAYYFIKDLQTEAFHTLVHDVVCAMEEAGFTVTKSMCDGPSTSPDIAKQISDEPELEGEILPAEVTVSDSQQELPNVMQLLLPMMSPKFQIMTDN